MTRGFLADADLNRAIVCGVQRREPTIDFMAAQAASLEGMPDSDVLAVAAREGRILVSHDFGTMPHHFRDCVAQQDSPRDAPQSGLRLRAQSRAQFAAQLRFATGQERARRRRAVTRNETILIAT